MFNNMDSIKITGTTVAALILGFGAYPELFEILGRKMVKSGSVIERTAYDSLHTKYSALSDDHGKFKTNCDRLIQENKDIKQVIPGFETIQILAKDEMTGLIIKILTEHDQTREKVMNASRIIFLS